MPPPNRKAQHLKQTGGLNRHPEACSRPWFQADGFFDSRDLVQVKYEMLRQVRIEGAEKSEAASLFGVSRPTFYQAEADFARAGLSGRYRSRAVQGCAQAHTRSMSSSKRGGSKKIRPGLAR